MPVRCDDSGKWAFVDLALATAGLFLFIDAEGEGIGAYAATTGTLVFGVSSVMGFRNMQKCRCLHEAWLERERPR